MCVYVCVSVCVCVCVSLCVCACVCTFSVVFFATHWPVIRTYIHILYTDKSILLYVCSSIHCCYIYFQEYYS